ncbi:carboxypeptidase regulatory-like domain-containing protein [Cellulophaga baltica]|uniref:TonB-dependent receptor n=1 Tax=Cellulophaga baltica TaxID=76594 RepID=UPI0021486FF6|nr:carboxypeptidase regulatory-like domain-containing protein [Cellulophaga baltica]MCR1025545.1 carboxypeptidase regulatory-like domain-containing protein [Cellulophaga baltica]
MRKFYFTIVALLFSAVAFSQGITTSAIGGQVTDETGEPLPGASIVAVHTPSGSTYGAATDFDGYYRISNMRTGGPYKITISYIGYVDFNDANVFLQLGDAQRISVTLGESANELDEIVVVAQSNGVFDSGKTGAGTNVSQKQVNNLPTISRNIADFARLTPQAQVSGDDVISIAGQNNRYNAIYIDGAVNNDVFGLAGNGTNGGQTGVSPISLDAIESFQINVAPFDVRQSGFSGGSINAVTKSGTNTIEGSVYGFYRNQDLAGKTPTGLAGDDERAKLAEFSSQTYGIRVGGPIIKDKLFYFVNYERQDNETPQPFNISTYRGSVTEGQLTQLSDFLSANYGYDAGGYENNTSTLQSDKLIAKIDWNINDNNKLSLKHSYVKAVQFNAPGSNQGAINFLNGAVNFKSVTNSTALELSSKIGDNMSNNLIIGYTTVNDDRGVSGSPFPSVQIFDTSGSSIYFGSEPFSTANLLEQKVLTLSNNFEIYKGAHTITIGTNNEFSSAYNVFFGNNYGAYRYNNIDDFLNGVPGNRYRYGYSLLGGSGDDSEGAADFDLFQFGLYVQDQVNITDDFKFTIGARIDVPYWEDGLVNDDFNTRTVGILESNGKNLQGARVGQGIDATVHFSPRVGFNWDVKGNRSTQIRGGLGVFTSRIPLVWPGGAYNNNGVTAGSLQLTGGDVPVFNSDVNNQFADPLPGTGALGGDINLFAKDFKLPQVFKINIAIDQKLPGDVVFSGDFIWNDNISAVTYENLNLPNTPSFLTTGAGSRPNYGFGALDRTYGAVYLGSNTGEGSSYNVSGSLSKNFYSTKVDVTSQVTYSYGDSDGIFDATSSQNSSQWRNLETVNGSNRPDLSTSDFSPGNRIIANSTIEFKWSDKLRTRLGFFYEGAEGTPFSYVYNGSGLLSDTGSFSALAYVPANAAEAQLVSYTDGGATVTAAEQWTSLNAFIESDDYLSSRRGQFAERNASRSDWTHIVDLKFAQEFRFQTGKTLNKIEFTADIFNFTNLLNKDWGVRTFTNFNQVQLLNFEGFQGDGTTPTFTYNESAQETTNIIDDSGLNSSRWQMQLGLRYSF